MSDILNDYREWRGKQRDRIGTHSDRCHMWHERCMIHRLAAALAAEQAKRTPETHATPGEGSVQAGRTCHRCGGDGIQLTEANTYGEATCGTCGGSGRLN